MQINWQQWTKFFFALQLLQVHKIINVYDLHEQLRRLDILAAWTELNYQTKLYPILLLEQSEGKDCLWWIISFWSISFNLFHAYLIGLPSERSQIQSVPILSFSSNKLSTTFVQCWRSLSFIKTAIPCRIMGHKILLSCPSI